ncbi:MAG: hypothetical protein NZ750_07715 [Anaerolineae bacterium]|nr:hypothetical protein [Anaerolineae bacterium]MDW8172236.1 hypothetical protein [Anaerolineae bacterium]
MKPARSPSAFTLVAASILLLGISLHLVGHDDHFPSIDEFDEARLTWNGYLYRQGRLSEIDLDDYPPGIFAVHRLAQPLGEAQTGRVTELEMAAALRWMRWFSAAVNLLSAALLIHLGRALGQPPLGLGLALASLALPNLLSQTRLALTESYQVLGYVAALAFAWRALRTRCARYALLSTLAGLMAVLFKYSAFPALGFGCGVALLLAWPLWKPSRWRGVLLAQLVLIASTAVVWLSQFDSLQIPEYQAFTNKPLWPLDWATLSRLLEVSIVEQLGWPLLAWVGAFGLGLLLVARRHWHERSLWIGLALGFGLHLWLVSRFLVYWEGGLRYAAPYAPLALLLVALPLAWMAQALRGALRLAWSGLVVVLAFVYLGSAVLNSAALAEVRTRPSTLAAIATWAIPILSEDEYSILVDRTIYHAKLGQRVFSRDRGGYRGDDWELFYVRTLEEKAVAQWVSEGVGYLLDSSLSRADNPDILLLRRFPPSQTTQTWQGPSLVFYRLWRPAHELKGVQLGQIRLIGYDLEGQASPGQTLRLRPYWQAAVPYDGQLQVYLHLNPLSGRDILAQADGVPVRDRPSFTWDDPTETLIGAPLSIVLPPDLPVGEYRLLLGLYDLVSGARLLDAQGRDHVAISLTVR